MRCATSNLFMIDIEGTELNEIEQNLLKHPNVGAVILFTRNLTNPKQFTQLINQIRQANSEIFIAVDHEGGFVQRFLRHGFRALPAARTYGDVYDLNPDTGIQLAKFYGELMAKDLLAYGVDLSLAPVLDIQDINPVIAHLDRAFHQNPDVVIALAGAFIEGMNKAGMPAVAKHFPGHGSVATDSHKSMPVSQKTLNQLKAQDLKPFIALIQKGLLSAIMPAHVTYNAVDAEYPAGFSTVWLQEILGKELQFQGLVLSDCLSMTGADIGDLKTRAETALKAGCHMLIVCHQPRTVLLELVQTINVTQSADADARLHHFKQQMLRFSPKDKNFNLSQTLMQQRQEQENTSNSSEHTQFNTTQTI